MTPTKHPKAWLALTDLQGAKLLLCSYADGGHTHLDQKDQTEFKWQESEHGRPSPLAAKDGRSYASPHHEPEEHLREFARQACRWFDHVAQTHGIDRLTVYAPPRCIGALREAAAHHKAADVDFQPGELTNLTTRELTDHPAVTRLLPPHSTP